MSLNLRSSELIDDYLLLLGMAWGEHMIEVLNRLLGRYCVLYSLDDAQQKGAG